MTGHWMRPRLKLRWDLITLGPVEFNSGLSSDVTMPRPSRVLMWADSALAICFVALLSGDSHAYG
jgi:hypothetical protein